MNYTVIDVTSFVNVDDDVAYRAVLDVNGHDVQVLAHDNSPVVVVKVDERIEQMDISEIDQFIRSKTS